MNPPTVLVTGAAGFVGINLVRGLANDGFHVTAVARRSPDALARAFLTRVTPQVSWLKGDVTDPSWLTSTVSELAPAAIVHAAAVTPSQQVERDETLLVIETNLTATARILDAAREAGVQRVVFASSTGVYAGSAAAGPRREEECLQGHNLYAVCKLASEALVSSYVRIHGISACSLRIGSVYGPMERTSYSRAGLSVVARLMPWAMHRGHLNVSGAEIGRDLIHAYDIADAVATILKAPTLRHDLFNLGSAEAYPICDILNQLATSSGATWENSEFESADFVLRPTDHRDGLDLRRLEDSTGWRPRVPFQAGIAHTFQWHALGENLDAIADFAGGSP